jgi:hypothetical protein
MAEITADKSYVPCLFSKRDPDSSWRDFNWWANRVCGETILFSTRPKSSNKRNNRK